MSLKNTRYVSNPTLAFQNPLWHLGHFWIKCLHFSSLWDYSQCVSRIIISSKIPPHKRQWFMGVCRRHAPSDIGQWPAGWVLFLRKSGCIAHLFYVTLGAYFILKKTINKNKVFWEFLTLLKIIRDVLVCTKTWFRNHRLRSRFSASSTWKGPIQE